MIFSNAEKLVLALVLGDGHLQCFASKSASLSISHSAEQRGWLACKSRLLREIGLSPGTRPVVWAVKDRTYDGFELYCRCDEFRHLHPLLYPDGKRAFLESVIASFEEREIAILWCDDGCLHERIRVRADRPNPTSEWQGCLGVYRPHDEAKLLADRIETVTGAKSWLVYHKPSDSFQIRMGGPSLRKFLPSIAPQVPECMSKKIDLTSTPMSERAQVLKQRAIRRHERAASDQPGCG